VYYLEIIVDFFVKYFQCVSITLFFSDILDLLRSSTPRIEEEEAAVEDGVEVNVEEEDSEDEVLVLEDTTGGQDRERSEVIICVTVVRLSRVADLEPHNFDQGFGSALI
jgi:hypothetical protein